MKKPRNIRVFKREIKIKVPKPLVKIPARLHMMQLNRMEKNINRICEQLNRCLLDLEKPEPENGSMEILREIVETEPTIEIPKNFRI